MDESAYRETLSAAIPRHCPFEKSILTHCAACSQAGKHNIAEREVVTCDSAAAHQSCVELRGLLRDNFHFALGRSLIAGPLPHAQEMRMQCGGLKGLQFALDGGKVQGAGNDVSEVSDVAALLTRAVQRYGGLAELPFAAVVRWAMNDYRGRRARV